MIVGAIDDVLTSAEVSAWIDGRVAKEGRSRPFCEAMKVLWGAAGWTAVMVKLAVWPR